MMRRRRPRLRPAIRGSGPAQVPSRTEYRSGIVALPFEGGSADAFVRAVASEAGRRDAGFAFLFHSLSAFDTPDLAAALARRRRP